MADPTAVNGQITDAVTQAGVNVFGDAPAQAMGNLLQATAHAVGVAAQNAVTNQQLGHQLGEAVTARCVDALLGKAKG